MTDTIEPAHSEIERDLPAGIDPNTLPGLSVLHNFLAVESGADRHRIITVLKDQEREGSQIVTAAMLGHKADLCVLALNDSPRALRRLQSELALARCRSNYSYLSLTELSEYSARVPDAMKLARLRPHLPPEGYEAFCFYPMSKRRLEADNWYRVTYEERYRMMTEHGASGRNFRGRVVQLITGSTGLDDYEWGVTLFAKTLGDLKECVYSMRFDEASARYAEFGDFLTGIVGSPDEVLDLIGVSR